MIKLNTVYLICVKQQLLIHPVDRKNYHILHAM